MKKLLAATAIALSMASPALADDAADKEAYLAVLMLVYDSGCENLPPLTRLGIADKVATMPDSLLGPANKKAHDQLTAEGPAAFCAWLKPIVDRNLAGRR